MTTKIDLSFAFEAEDPTDVLLQFEAAAIPEQTPGNVTCNLGDAEHIARVSAQDDIGERIWVRTQGRFEVEYSAEVELNRILTELGDLERLDTHDLPGETVKYLFDSRYCQADKLQGFVSDKFGDHEGGAKIVAMHEWVRDTFKYTPGVSDANTTGVDSFLERRGICRDYAHVMIMLARASAIPARFVSCYAPGVEPPDFHAVAEVFLQDPTTEGGGAWYLVDATDMASANDIVKIGVGRDAADVSFMTSFGMTEFKEKTVTVTDDAAKQG